MARRTRPSKSGSPRTPPVEQPQPPGIPVATGIDMAYRHWEAGQEEQAQILCRQVLEVWPGQADVLHLLGLMAHAAGQFDAAIEYLRQACAVPTAPAAYFSNLGEMCRRRNRLEEAENAARQAVERDPALPGAWSNCGIILQEAGKLEESEACLVRAVALAPESAQGHNNLGNTLRLLNRLGDAAASYDTALALDPLYADACSNLGHLTAELGRPDQGLALLRRAIGIEPRMADAYLNAAALESNRERWLEALGWLEALRDFAPDHPKLPAGRARILLHLGRLEEAQKEAEAAIAINPGDPVALQTSGMVLQALEHFDDALEAFNAAAAVPGPLGEAGLLSRGVLLTELGRLDEGRSTFAEARERFPRSASAWYGGMDLMPFEPGDTARLEAIFADPSALVHRDQVTWHFVLGNAWLDAGDAARAFDHLGQGNRLKRAIINYDANATDDWLTDIARAFPAARFQDPPPLGARTPPERTRAELPVFIIGMPRSGSSLVEQILASHPAIHGAGELGAMQHIVSRVFTPDGQAVPYPNLIRTAGSGHLADMGQRYLDLVAGKAGGAERLVDKMPTNFLYAGLIALMLPGSRIIHCHREPLDCCLSNYAKLFLEQHLFTYDMTELGRFYRGYERLMDHWLTVLPPARLVEVRYEDLVEDLETQARRLIAFCGLPWDPACLDFHRTERLVATASAVQVRRPAFRDSIGRGAVYAQHLAPLIAALGNRGV